MPVQQPRSRPLFIDAGVGPGRWWIAALLGTALSVGGILLSYVLSSVRLGRVEGFTYALVGILQAALVTLAVWIGLKPVGLSLNVIGVRGPSVGRDALLGAGVAIVFAVAQFAVLIPLTGGAERSDVLANTSQIDGDVRSVVGLIALAWTGGVAEELLFRGHFLHTVRNALGESKTALLGAAALTVVLFGALHGYQGWAGVVDTGLYGGVVLTALFIYTDGRLTACAVAHAGWNTLAVLGLYLWY